MPVVTDYTALISGYSWNGMTDPGAPVFVSYTFLDNDEVPSLADYEPYDNDGYYEFTATQRQSFRDALDQFELIAGVEFIEVDNPDLASIDIMNTSGSQWGGWANYGIATDWYTTDGYIVIDGTGSYASGTGWFEVLLHEVGHAMGLKHPFSGDITLDPSLDNDDHTLMSYTSNGVYDTSLAHLDVDALQHLYGDQTNISAGWSWDWSDATQIFTLAGAATEDILIGIDAASTISGFGGNDTLWGRDAADTLIGGAGNDTLNGGSGSDTAVFSGNRSDYSIAELSAGVFTVSDNRINADGLDTVTNIEFYQFADGTVATNNILAGGSGLPDYIAGNVSVTGSTFSLGQTVEVSYDITNQGSEELFTFSTVSVYLSQDGVFDPATATLVASEQLFGLAANEVASRTTSFIVPAGFSGPYDIFVVADDLNDIAESNENNNVSTSFVSINITAPDLTTSNLSVADTTLITGQDTTVTFNLNNIGNEIADLFAVNTGIYLSTDSTITSSDTNLVNHGHSFDGDLAAGGTLIGVSQDITLPAGLAPGTYYIGTIADDSNILAEGNEDNNASPASIQITVEAPAVDLTVTNLAVADTSLITGQSTTVSSSLNNIGNIALTSNFNYGIYLSTDATITTGDTLLGFQTNGFDIAAGASITNIAAPDGFTIPANLAAGTYYVGIIADYDNQIAESDEGNNASPSPVQITVAAAEVDLRVHATHNIDDTTLTTGQTANYTYNITNDGNFASGAFNVGFYLSTDTTITTADTLIGTEAIASLAALTSLGAHTTQITIPASLGGGTYFIGIIADYDNQISESDETNNDSPSTTGIIVQAPTDLSPADVTVTSGTYNVGTSFDVTFDVDNLSVETSGTYDVTIYLSSDNSITTGDYVLGTFTYSSLAGGASLADQVASVTIPTGLGIADGSYYIGVYVDPNNSVAETNENNNIAVAANTVTIHNPIADLVASDFKQQNGSAEVPTGGEVTFTFDINNAGDLASGNFDARIYLSTDSTITTGDILLTTLTNLTIAAGATINDQSVTFTIPSNYNLDDYHFGVVLDYNNQITESDETNNASGTAISIVAAAPGDDPGVASQWYINNPGGYDLNVQDVWPDYTGNGVKLAIIDTGIDYNHTDLAPNYDTSLDYDFGDNDSDAIFEGSEAHGTQVAGVAGGASNGLGIIGVAPDLTLFSYRYDATTFAQAVAQWTSALNQATTDADIVNMSLGFQQWNGDGVFVDYYLTGAFQDNFLDAAYSAFGTAFENTATDGRGGLGTIITVSAGNELIAEGDVNFDNMLNSPYTIAVGSVTSTGAQSFFSNGGAALLVTAPGSGIYTTDPTGSAGISSGDYTTTDGTSFSSPAVAGVVALMLEANSTLGARDVQEILAYSAIGSNYASNGAGNWNGGGIYTSLSQGFGRVDAKAAVRLAETWVDQHTFGNVTELVYTSGTVNLAIPDNAGSVTDTITISYPNNFELDHVEVFVDLTHTAIDDLTIKIISPDGLNSYLLDTPPTGLYQDFPTNGFTFMTTQFWGEDISGDWIISIQDRATGDTGTLEDWSLIFYGDVDDGNDTYFYNDEYSDYDQNGSRATLTDSDGGTDTINASQVTTASTIDLRAGNTSTIDGESLTIAAGTTIENAYGGDGDDTLYGNAANNVLSGGRGTDTVSFSDDTNGIVVDLSASSNQIIGAGVGINQLESIEIVYGGSGTDQFTGTNNADIFFGATGDDIFYGGAAADTYHGGGDTDTVDYSSVAIGTVALNLDTGVFNGYAAAGDTFDSIERFIGTDRNDYFAGDHDGNIFEGGLGNDYITGRWGDDTIRGGDGGDTLYGGVDNDQLYGDAGNDGMQGGDGNDFMYGGDGNDVLLAGAGTDVLEGGDGNDRLNGGSGDDWLIGGAGDDVLLGSTGDDTADYSADTQGITIEYSTNTVTGAAIGTDTLTDIEFILVGSGDDTFNGGTLDDVFSGHSVGGDRFFGGGGIDTVDYSDVQIGVVSINLDIGTALGFAAAGDTFDSIEHFIGTDRNDYFAGDHGDNIFEGGLGNDYITGRWGDDTIRGGESGDTLYGGVDNDHLYGGDGGDGMQGGDGNDFMYGEAGNDVLLGGAGVDYLYGGIGNDRMNAGAGADHFIFEDLFGLDTIVGFEDGLDVLNVSAVTGASAATLTISIGASGNVFADFGTGDSIEFLGVTDTALIDANDFDF